MLIGNTITVDIPHEPGCTFTYVPLSGPQLAKADSLGTQTALTHQRTLGPQATKAAAEAAGDDDDDELCETREDVLAADEGDDSRVYNDMEYDTAHVLKCGVRSFDGDGYEKFAKKRDVEKLDPITYDWAYQTILRGTDIPSS